MIYRAIPLADRHKGHPETTRDLRLRETGTQQRETVHPTFFESGGVVAPKRSSSHAESDRASRTLIHLRNSQQAASPDDRADLCEAHGTGAPDGEFSFGGVERG